MASLVGDPATRASLERRSARWDTDVDAARDALLASVALLLRLLGRESDPAKSREHVLLSALAERRLLAGDSAEIANLIADLEEPPIARIGAMDVDEYIDPRTLCARREHELAARIARARELAARRHTRHR